MFAQHTTPNLGLAVLGGGVGSAVMKQVMTGMYALESDETRRMEEAVRPGEPFEIAADRCAYWIGVQLTDGQRKGIATAVHYGLGMSLAPIYIALRRRTELHPALIGGLMGVSAWLLLDELLTPTLGLSAPNSAYPAAAHVRGVVAHTVLGLTLAAATELFQYGFRRLRR